MDARTRLSVADYTPREAFMDFRIDRETIERTLEAGLSRGGDFCELFFQDQSTFSLTLEDRAIRTGVESRLFGVGVRVLKGEQTGYSHTSDLSAQGLLAAVRAAALISDGNAPVRSSVGDPRIESPRRPRPYPLADSAVDIRAAKEWLEALDGAARGLDPRIVTLRATVHSQPERVLIANSEGLLVADSRPLTGYWIMCVAEAGDRRESAYESIARRMSQETILDSAQAALAAARLAGKVARLFEARPAPFGEFPLILKSGGGGILLHEAMGHGFEADFIRKGTSLFSGRLGEKIASDEVSIVDSGRIDGDSGAVSIDDEGVPGEKTILIRNGTLESWLHDRMSARHFGVRPTGNGRRQDYRFPPLPRMRTTYMESGSRAPEEIIASVERGIYAEEFQNGQVQIGAGDFAFYMAAGRMIEHGKLTYPIKDANLIGNGPRVLQDIEMVGNDLELEKLGGCCGKGNQSVFVGFGIPTLKVRAITVGGRG